MQVFVPQMIHFQAKRINKLITDGTNILIKLDFKKTLDVTSPESVKQ